MTELQICAGPAEWGRSSEELETIEQAKRDPDAFARLYRAHYRAIARYILRRTGDMHVTEDLVADVFTAALRHLPRYRQRGVPIRCWFYRIATNAVNRWSRSAGRQRAAAGGVDLALQPAEREQVEAGNEARELAQYALLQLSPKHQTVVALHYLEGMTVEEVAQVIGCRAGTVKSRLSRARESLRSHLQDLR